MCLWLLSRGREITEGEGQGGGLDRSFLFSSFLGFIFLTFYLCACVYVCRCVLMEKKKEVQISYGCEDILKKNERTRLHMHQSSYSYFLPTI